MGVGWGADYVRFICFAMHCSIRTETGPAFILSIIRAFISVSAECNCRLFTHTHNALHYKLNESLPFESNKHKYYYLFYEFIIHDNKCRLGYIALTVRNLNSFVCICIRDALNDPLREGMEMLVVSLQSSECEVSIQSSINSTLLQSNAFHSTWYNKNSCFTSALFRATRQTIPYSTSN